MMEPLLALKQLTHSLLKATLLTLTAAAAFGAFFQLSKQPIFATVNPFAEDPVDAIGSIAVQIAAFAALLTLARVARFTQEPSDYRRHLILRGNFLTVAVIAITLLADTVLEIQQPSWGVSMWGQLLVLGLIVSAALASVAGAATFRAWQQTRSLPLPIDGSDHPEALAETLDDLWLLVCVILHWFERIISILRWPLSWIEKIGAIVLDKVDDLPLVGARRHPWRFCVLVSLGAGMALSMMHVLHEGIPENIITAIMIAGFLIVAEFTVVVLGFVIFGGFLGIRPRLQ